MDPGSTSYLHGTQAEEQGRLSRLNEMLNEESLRLMELGGGERILDVGSGLGQLSRAMARAVGRSGSVIGIERSHEQIEEAQRQAAAAGEESLLEIRPGSAYDLPLSDEEWGSFDVVHSRFLLEHLPEPERAVASMLRAVRPGGRIILEDDDHEVLRLWPEPAGFAGLWSAYMATFERLGCDPIIGRRLVSILHSAGATPTRNRWLSFGGCAGHPQFPAIIRNFVGILQGARQEMVSGGLVEPAAFDRGVEAFEAWGGRPDAAMWYARAWAEGRRP